MVYFMEVTCRFIMLSAFAAGLLSSIPNGPAQAQCGGAKADCGVPGAAANPGGMFPSRFYFKNNCRYSVRMAMKWRSRDGTQVDGWWDFQPGEEYYLTSSNKPVRLVRDDFYYYAESMNKKNRQYWYGKERVEVHGRDLTMRKTNRKSDGDGNRFLSISCKQ